MASRVSTRLSRADGRRFGLTVGGVFLLLGAANWWRHHIVASELLLGVGLVFVLAGLVIPGHLGPVERVWMAIAHQISKVTTPIAMAIVYFGAISTIGVLMRAIGKNPLRHSDSGWIKRDDGGRSDLQRQF